MASTNCEPEIAIVYSSITGNTAEVAGMVMECAQQRWNNVRVFGPKEFCRENLGGFDAVVVGTYTWASGEIPHEMRKVYRHFEQSECKPVVTAVFGTGDSFFADFCGAVDRFKEMLFHQTSLAAVMKVELSPEDKDRHRCEKLIAAVERKLASVMVVG